MKRTWLCGALLMAGLLMPLGGASIDTTGCTVYTSHANEVGGFYLWGTSEIWEESNGIRGLQRISSDCEGRAPLPADTCWTHTENRQLVACATSAYAHTLP